MPASSTPSLTVVARLQQAINAHDLDAVVACFAPDYRNETPTHPARNFTGRDQVHRNWTHILAAVPDLTAQVSAAQPDPSGAWVEWEWAGTRPDDTSMRLRGVTILGIEDGLIVSARFYMEPVDDGPATYDTVVPDQVGARPTPAEPSGVQ